jgi:KDO2-lipid IV(A) lauroyltransferase
MMAIIIKFLFYLVRLLPVRLAGAIGAGLGRVAYFLNARHRHIAMRNLTRVYPDKSGAWKRKISRESFAELGRTMFEIPHVFLRSREFLLSRIDYDGIDEARAVIDSGQGAIFTCCHHSNWELSAQTLALLGYQPEQIYRTLRQHSLDILLKQWRERFGNILHSRSGSMRWLPKAIRTGQPVAVMVDQHLSNGVPVPFLGHPANSTTMPAVYARKYDTPVFAAILHRKGHDFRFRAEFRRIKFPEASDNVDQDLCDFTEAVYANYAEAIHQRPELWLWIHRRWLYLDEQEVEGAQNA